MIIKSLLMNKESKNAIWIISSKVAQMIISLFINIWTTRYLGPSNYGLISYVSAYIAFFTSFCTLGITSAILVNELTEKPEEEGVTLGTTIVLRIFSSLLSAVFVICVVALVDNDEPITIWIAVLSSIALVFQVFDTFEYWFQKRYMSKVTAIVSFVAYLCSAFYKIVLLMLGKGVVYFALASSIDYIVIALALYIVYKKNRGPKLSFSWKRGKEILSKSYHFILSGMMVAIYGQTDKLMLKQMLSETEVGYYTVASTLSTMWVFVLSAIITSVAPTIIKYKNEGIETEYERKNIQLYSIVFYISIFVSICFTVLAPSIISIMYGKAYENSIQPLRVITWYVAFSYLGCARDIWMVCENKQKYSKYMYLLAAIINIILNGLFIPLMGATGAALASLITQISTSFLLPMVWKDMRLNVKMMLQGMNPVVILKVICNKEKNGK